MIDHYDSRLGMTSMARTTTFPCSVAVQMLGAGMIEEKGLIPPELAFKGTLRRRFLIELAGRGIRIASRTWLEATNTSRK